MAVFLPLLVIGGAPVCYATYKVFDTVDKETTRLLAHNEKQTGKTIVECCHVWCRNHVNKLTAESCHIWQGQPHTLQQSLFQLYQLECSRNTPSRHKLDIACFLQKWLRLLTCALLRSKWQASCWLGSHWCFAVLLLLVQPRGEQYHWLWRTLSAEIDRVCVISPL